MRRVVWKRIVSTLVSLAFIAATLGPIIPHASAAVPCAMMMTSSSMGGDHSSKDAMPVCGSDLSCVIAVALPAPFAPTATDLVWTPVRYWTAVNALTGVSIPPDISPPRSRA